MSRCRGERQGDNSAGESAETQIYYPKCDVDRSLNEDDTDKIRKYRSDYNNRPPTSISFMPAIVSTSDRLHSEFVLLLFYKLIGKLTAFFQLQEFSVCNPTVSHQFHYRRSAFCSKLKTKTGLVLVKATSFWCIATPRDLQYLKKKTEGNVHL